MIVPLSTPSLADEDPLLACLVTGTSSTEINAYRKRMLRIYDESAMKVVKRANQSFRLATVILATSRCRAFADRLETDGAESIFENYGAFLNRRILAERQSVAD